MVCGCLQRAGPLQQNCVALYSCARSATTPVLRVGLPVPMALLTLAYCGAADTERPRPGLTLAHIRTPAAPGRSGQTTIQANA